MRVLARHHRLDERRARQPGDEPRRASSPQVQAKVKNVAFGVVDFRTSATPTSSAVRLPHPDGARRRPALDGGAERAQRRSAAGGGGDGPEAGWRGALLHRRRPARSRVERLDDVVSTLNLAGATPTTPPPRARRRAPSAAPASAPARCRSSSPSPTPSGTTRYGASPPSGENGLNDYALGTLQPCNGAPSRAHRHHARCSSLGAHVMGLAGTAAAPAGNPKARTLALAQDTGAVVNAGRLRPRRHAPGRAAPSTSAAPARERRRRRGAAAAAPCPLSFTVRRRQRHRRLRRGRRRASSRWPTASSSTSTSRPSTSIPAPSTTSSHKLVPEPQRHRAGGDVHLDAAAPLQDNFTGPKAHAPAATACSTPSPASPAASRSASTSSPR